MTPADVDAACASLRAQAQKSYDALESQKSFAGWLIGTNADDTSAQGAIAQILAMPGDVTGEGGAVGTYNANQATNIYNLQQFGEAAAGDPTQETQFNSVLQLAAHQCNASVQAGALSSASVVLTSTASATASDVKDDVKVGWASCRCAHKQFNVSHFRSIPQPNLRQSSPAGHET